MKTKQTYEVFKRRSSQLYHLKQQLIEVKLRKSAISITVPLRHLDCNGEIFGQCFQ